MRQSSPKTAKKHSNSAQSWPSHKKGTRGKRRNVKINRQDAKNAKKYVKIF